MNRNYNSSPAGRLSPIISMRQVAVLIFLGFVLTTAGCGAGGNSSIAQVPITVSLPISTVVLPRNGTQVIVPISISSTSETALVSITGLPGGVQEKYAASDTNPSGSLAFTASAATPTGTYTPRVTVNSAGQTASLNFKLVVTTATSALQNRQTIAPQLARLVR
jgi:hypothetical protein